MLSQAVGKSLGKASWGSCLGSCGHGALSHEESDGSQEATFVPFFFFGGGGAGGENVQRMS